MRLALIACDEAGASHTPDALKGYQMSEPEEEIWPTCDQCGVAGIDNGASIEGLIFVDGMGIYCWDCAELIEQEARAAGLL